jgi:hypothetical protein
MAPSLAMTKTLRRQRGWVSEAKAPSEAAMRMRRSSSLSSRRGPGRCGVEGAGGAIGAQDQFEAGGEVEIEAAEGDGVEVGGGGFGESLDGLLGGAGGDEGGGAGGVEQALGAEIVSVGVAGALAGEDADAAAGAGALAGGFDDLLVDAEGGGGDGLEVEVGVVAAGGEASPRQRSSRRSVMPNFSKK